MKELDLLTILTNVKGEYVLQAQTFRSGQSKLLRVMHRKRIFLIAAMISLLLLLVGCAAVLVALQKISLGKVTFPQYKHEGWTLDLASTNGYLDSVNYRATQEWLSFITSYDPDRSLEQEKDTNGYTAPQDYREYYCYTPQMQEKVEEICRKYNLEPIGPAYFTQEPEQVFSAVGISSIAKGFPGDPISLSGGAYYRSGSFNMVGTLQHCFEGRSTADSILFVYTCDRKSVFFPDYVSLRDMDHVDSWEYTAWDGTKLILVQGPARGIIVADVGAFSLSITLDFCYSSPSGEVDADNPCIRSELEGIADSFTYQITPLEPASDWLQNPFGLNAGAVLPTYADYFSEWMPGSVGSSAYSPDYQQRFLDLDADGWDEMLIWNARTGVIYEVVARVDRELLCVYGGGTYQEDDHTVSLYLCEGNVLERDCPGLQGKQLHEYYRLQDHQLTIIECILLGSDGTFHWSECGGASSVMWKQISEAEYNAVLSRYPRIEVPQLPTPEATEAIAESEANILLQVLQSQALFHSTSADIPCTLFDYCRAESSRIGSEVAVTRYALVDMDEDGIQEAVVDFRFGENRNVMCMILKYDSETVFGTEFYYRQMNQIKADGSFAYSGSADHDGWARLRWKNHAWVTEDTENSSTKADAAWHSYPIEQ